MKKFAVLFAMLLALPCAAQFDFVSVELELDQQQYLPNEPLIAHVKVLNSSGQTLQLGEDASWMNFVLEPVGEGGYVKQLKQPDVVKAFSLPSAHTATKHIDLAPCFDLTKRGQYQVSVAVKVPAFRDQVFLSNKKKFFIGGGTTRWQTAFGVPGSAKGADGRPEVRKYMLVESSPGRGEVQLFVRVTDEAENNIKAVLLGPLIGFAKPEPQLDRWSNLHVLYQIGAKEFLYTAINPEGMILARERHDYVESKPALAANAEGRISVKGGMRRYTKNDLPPVDPALALAPPQVEQAPLVLGTPAPVKGKKDPRVVNDTKKKSK